MKKTVKLYYEDFFLTKCEATVIDKSPKGVVCDRTVAFAEGGGQEGDTGVLTVYKNGKQMDIPFTDTQKGYGRVLYLDDFPVIQVETPIYHVVDESHLQYFEIGDKVQISINVERRARLTVSHTGIHLVLMGIEKLYPNLSKQIKGAEIRENQARLDFFKKERFTPEELETISSYVNRLVNEDKKIDVFVHPDEPEAWYWRCEDFTIPCGGTHLPSTGYTGNIVVRRKTKGVNYERIIAQFPNANLPLDLYHEEPLK